MDLRRCPWAGPDPLYIQYHDTEWGVPLHDDIRLFEMIVLESMQSGLSWITVLRKRDAFRRAFLGFDAEQIATFDQNRIESLMANPDIIRNRAKINAAIVNARTALRVKEKFGSLDLFFWRLVDFKPITNHRKTYLEVPAKTDLSEKLAKECKSAGFIFFGPIVAYAFMQAVGMVNDHETGCFRFGAPMPGR
ncbi:MAG: DNA-3-methyladenine glycosylase I [Verrucomicrobia bacterium]|nr:DNA-3-methyladenine glycosylase I [Verrucomicrobiota bacterium]